VSSVWPSLYQDCFLNFCTLWPAKSRVSASCKCKEVQLCSKTRAIELTLCLCLSHPAFASVKFFFYISARQVVSTYTSSWWGVCFFEQPPFSFTSSVHSANFRSKGDMLSAMDFHTFSSARISDLYLRDFLLLRGCICISFSQRGLWTTDDDRRTVQHVFNANFQCRLTQLSLNDAGSSQWH